MAQAAMGALTMVGTAIVPLIVATTAAANGRSCYAIAEAIAAVMVLRLVLQLQGELGARAP